MLPNAYRHVVADKAQDVRVINCLTLRQQLFHFCEQDAALPDG
jgi:hypothetical protein